MALEAPRTQVYSIEQKGFHCRVTVTVEAATVEDWIRGVKKEFLDAAEVKCVGLDCEFTDTPYKVKKWQLQPHQMQRAAVLQLCVSYQCLVFQICRADTVPELLRQFLADENIIFYGAAIKNDQDRLEYYGINILGAKNLQSEFINPARDYPPSLVTLCNAYLGTNLTKNDEETMDMRRGGWEAPLTRRWANYAALGARLGFELGRFRWQLVGY